jgi:choline dehydrogenase-like flavoprotein
MGTCVMGDNLPDSVVDRWRKAHDCSNLWIVDSSMFPTSAISNPTLTIAALALRPRLTVKCPTTVEKHGRHEDVAQRSLYGSAAS